MGISSLSMGQSLPSLAKVQAAVANRSGAIQKAELPDDVTTVGRRKYDVATISEEGKAAAQALNAAPIEGSSTKGLFLDAVGEPFEPSEIPDGNDYEAQEEFEKRCDTHSDLIASRNALIEELKSECDNRLYYSAKTGLYYVNYSETIRLFQTRLWEWQENLRKNDPYAFELWVEKHGELKEPKFPEPGKGDLYQVIDLTPDAEGKTELDRFYMLFQRMKDQAALIEKLYQENTAEKSDDSSATERIKTQSAELEGDLQANNSEVSETQTDISADNDSQQQERQSS